VIHEPCASDGVLAAARNAGYGRRLGSQLEVLCRLPDGVDRRWSATRTRIPVRRITPN